MAKKQAQFRFEEKLYSDINKLASSEGSTVSEIVRNALKMYLAVYERTKGKKAKLYIELQEPQEERCEIILPWLL